MLDRLGYALEKVCSVNQPCRMQKVVIDQDLTAYIDVCHNISGLEAVLRELKMTHPGKSIRVACAFSKMKDITTMIEFLLSQVKSIHFMACPHFKVESINNLYQKAQEAADAASQQAAAENAELTPLIAGGDIVQTLNNMVSIAQSTHQEEVLLVCGSFYIMDDVKNYFFRDETLEADPASVNAK